MISFKSIKNSLIPNHEIGKVVVILMLINAFADALRAATVIHMQASMIPVIIAVLAIMNRTSGLIAPVLNTKFPDKLRELLMIGRYTNIFLATVLVSMGVYGVENFDSNTTVFIALLLIRVVNLVMGSSVGAAVIELAAVIGINPDDMTDYTAKTMKVHSIVGIIALLIGGIIASIDASLALITSGILELILTRYSKELEVLIPKGLKDLELHKEKMKKAA
jgi:hypothetical protein